MRFNSYPLYREKFGGMHFWARGCYLATVGNVSKETILEYIKNKKKMTNYKME